MCAAIHQLHTVMLTHPVFVQHLDGQRSVLPSAAHSKLKQYSKKHRFGQCHFIKNACNQISRRRMLPVQQKYMAPNRSDGTR